MPDSELSRGQIGMLSRLTSFALQNTFPFEPLLLPWQITVAAKQLQRYQRTLMTPCCAVPIDALSRPPKLRWRLHPRSDFRPVSSQSLTLLRTALLERASSHDRSMMLARKHRPLAPFAVVASACNP